MSSAIWSKSRDKAGDAGLLEYGGGGERIELNDDAGERPWYVGASNESRGGRGVGAKECGKAADKPGKARSEEEDESSVPCIPNMREEEMALPPLLDIDEVLPSLGEGRADCRVSMFSERGLSLPNIDDESGLGDVGSHGAADVAPGWPEILDIDVEEDSGNGSNGSRRAREFLYDSLTSMRSSPISFRPDQNSPKPGLCRPQNQCESSKMMILSLWFPHEVKQKQDEDA